MSTTLTAPQRRHYATATITELIDAGRAHESQAWEELVTRYSPAIHHVVTGFRFPEADTADVIQTTWLCAIENLDGLRDPRCFGGWLKTIARNECLHAYHRMRRETFLEPTATCPIIEYIAPESIFIAMETRRAVSDAVRRLPDKARQLITALYSDNAIAYRELGQAIAIPIGSIGPTRQRALRSLHQQLTSAGFGHMPSRMSSSI